MNPAVTIKLFLPHAYCAAEPVREGEELAAVNFSFGTFTQKQRRTKAIWRTRKSCSPTKNIETLLSTVCAPGLVSECVRCDN
jgi:hypothetical protein